MSIQSNFPNTKPSLLLDFANTKQLDPRITFTRASTATFYNGVTTAMAEQNLFLYSQDYSNAVWQKSQTTVTADSTVAPDGTTTADTITEDSSTAVHVVNQSISNSASTYTVSFFAKPNGRNFVYFSYYAAAVTNYISITFDVSTGAVTQSSASGSGFSVTSSSITASTNGFYRCVATFATGTTAFGFAIGVSSAGTFTPDNYGRNSYAGNGTGGVFVWGAQLEQRSAVTAYTATTSQPITNYIPVLLTAGGNQARFDCNPTTGESLGLLIEEQRTNLVTYSGDFGNAAWSKSDATTLSNSIVAPDGTLTGTTFTATNASAGYIFQTSTLNTTATQSFYAKAGTATSIRLDFVTSGFAQGASCTFNLSAGTVGSINYYGASSGFTASITSVGNGWYRCSLTGLAPTATWYMELALLSNLNKYVFLWGGQWEAGNFPTSYIATTSASATRTTDLAVMTDANFNSWYNRAQGTLYINTVYIGGITGTPQETNAIWIDDTTSNNRIALRTVRDTSSAQADVTVSSGGSINLDTGGFVPTTIGTTYQRAFSYTPTTASHFVNMVSDVTNAVYIPPLNTSRLAINGAASGGFYLKKLSYYPASSTATQLQALTS